MIDVKNISIANFTYHLPNDKIALHPLQNRDDQMYDSQNDGLRERGLASRISKNHLKQNRRDWSFHWRGKKLP